MTLNNNGDVFHERGRESRYVCMCVFYASSSLLQVNSTHTTYKGLRKSTMEEDDQILLLKPTY